MVRLKERVQEITLKVKCCVCGHDNPHTVFNLEQGKLYCFPCLVVKYPFLARQIRVWASQIDEAERTA